MKQIIYGLMALALLAVSPAHISAQGGMHSVNRGNTSHMYPGPVFAPHSNRIPSALPRLQPAPVPVTTAFHPYSPAPGHLVHPPYQYNHWPHNTRVVNNYYNYNNYYYGNNGYYGYSPYGWYYGWYGWPWWFPAPVYWGGAVVYSGPVVLSTSQNYTPPSVQPSNQVNVVANADYGPLCPVGYIKVSDYLSNAKTISVPTMGNFSPIHSDVLQGWYITICMDNPSAVTAYGQKFITISVNQ